MFLLQSGNDFIGTEDDVDHLSDHSSAQSPPQPQRTPVNVRKRPRPHGMVQNVISHPAKRLSQIMEPSRTAPRLKHSAFGEHVAEKLRSMPQTAVVFCQKLINDAIFMAEIDNLNTTSRIVTNFHPGTAPSNRSSQN